MFINMLNLWQVKIYLIYLKYVCEVTISQTEDSESFAHFYTGVGYARLYYQSDHYFKKTYHLYNNSEVWKYDNLFTERIFFNDWLFINLSINNDFINNIKNIFNEIQSNLQKIDNKQQELYDKLS